MVAAGSINVAVRVRPPTSWEATRLPQATYDSCIRTDGALSISPAKAVTNNAPLREVIQIVDDRVLTFDPEERDASRAFVERGFLPPGTKRYKDRRFIFDKVFDHQARQEDVFHNTAKPLLTNLLDGYNATIFAYGATGCGKTHTISGTDADPGLIYLTMADLFQRIEDRREEFIIDVVVTFLEIYNEEIRDLLTESGTPTPRGGLQIREDKTVKVVGLQELRPKSADEVKAIVALGNSRRTQSPTHANETSSRSHAVLQVHVTQAPRTANITEQRTMGTFKLTRLLKFSLGGNCKTVMIVCIAPTSLHFDDTQNTLVYAERATRIKTKVVTRNVVNVDRHVGQYVEAINRLNLEVSELKQKLAGKRDVEADKERRRRQEAAAEVARSKSDMQVKAEQMQPSIVDGASCAGKVAIAEAKLKVIRTRLAQLDAEASTSSALSADLETERQLLRALAGPEEDVVKAQSALNVRVQRSNNSDAMFDATLRAVSERKSDKLDEYAGDNVKLDARWRKAEMERAKAEASRDVLKEAITTQAEAMVSLIGLVSRCTVMLSDASRILGTATAEGRDGLEATAKALSSSLGHVAESNDEAFKALLGHSVASYAVGAAPSSLQSFKGYPATLGRSTSGPSTSSQPAKPRVSRRSSSYGSAAPGSPLRKGHKSPRRSLRSSIAPSTAPYRRVSDKEKGKKKGVQWRDEAGQGNIDDGGLGAPTTTPSITLSTPDAAESSSASVFGPSSSVQKRPASVAGSESDWEDEKTEDSFNVSFSHNASLDASTSTVSASAIRKRPRASRLDPSFLKSKSRGSNLESLAENDEDIMMGTPTKRPLGDRNMNRIPSPTGSSSSSSTMDPLHIPKGRERQHGSPAKRVPMTPKVVLGLSKGARRRSVIGPMRNDRPRRRSSMIPQLSPVDRDGNNSGDTSQILNKSVGGARRVPINGGERSPAKRVKRMSLLSGPSSRMNASARLKIPDANTSAEMSFSKGVGKPTWR
ncbi:hypothetical protein FOMPIDRAFT_146176 [Fomitopsis schrenkii]|uniref:Kinesin motor domain-containing protein n=1 Tax=Fomitopsis schrenkii TaxID=2126942 RepID=S8F9M4_FOMSC|nr:hypothetical protein FOMPIDRAFT_146176 [Fomitopsis schrenkii]